MKIFDKVENKYKENVFMRRDFYDGEQIILRFDNNYGASFVNHNGSYGNEIAVLYFDGKDWSISYSTEITDDVLGHLTEEQVFETIESIKNLKEE